MRYNKSLFARKPFEEILDATINFQDNSRHLQKHTFSMDNKLKNASVENDMT
ncbi:hypothetical protein GH733_006998 [Mirounga leonina]|nr:hypothetical protein GH733_006998 [Mirounga leonina]